MKCRRLIVWVLAIFLILIGKTICAQRISGKQIEGLECPKPPEMYRNPTGEIANSSAARSKTEGSWVVYSDREDNQTYLDENLSKPYMKISFLTPCYVAEEKGNAVHIVKMSFSGYGIAKKGKTTVFTKESVENDLGWIEKSKMLLWYKSLFDAKTHFTKKAISVKKLSQADTTFRSYIKHHGILDFYNYPKDDQEYDMDRELKMFQYLFVYKADSANKMLLLGKINSTTPSQISDDILGWAPMAQVSSWTNALCLRVNFEQAAKEQREAKGVKIKFFADLEKARKFKNAELPEPVALPFNYSDPSDGKADNPYLLGYPILDGNEKDNGGIYKTGYITNTVDENGRNLYSVSTSSEHDQVIESANSQLNNITLMFVLDGSNRSAISTIAKAVEANSAIGSRQTTRNDYTFAAVVYNDVNCESDDQFDLVSPTTSINDFIVSLSRLSTAQSPCQINREQNGAPLFKALQKACSKFQSNKTTNVIICTGTTGDLDEGLKQSTINALTEKEVKMFFIQLLNKGGSIYDKFLLDSKDIMLETAKALDQKYFSKQIKLQKEKASDWTCSYEKCELLNSAIPGACYSKQRGGVFTPTEIKDYISKLIRKNENSLNGLIARSGNENTRKSKELTEEEEASQKELKMKYKREGFDDKAIEIYLSGNKYKLFIEGWASTIHKNVRSELLVKTLFLSRGEFERVYDAIQQVSQDVGTASEDKEAIYNAFISIIKSYRGGDIQEKRYEDWSINDWLGMITYLPVKNKIFEIDLGKIRESRTVTDDDVRKIKNAFKLIFERLKKVKNDKMNIYEVEENRFYWVPEKTFSIED